MPIAMEERCPHYCPTTDQSPSPRHRQPLELDVTQLMIQWPRAIFACPDP
jgi:hypothetical protein